MPGKASGYVVIDSYTPSGDPIISSYSIKCTGTDGICYTRTSTTLTTTIESSDPPEEYDGEASGNYID